MKTPGVRFISVDESIHTPSCPDSLVIAAGGLTKGPVESPVFIGTTIAPIKWWQPWRWHLIPRRKREITSARRKFNELFGTPGTK